jgi:hypothetical protein
MRKAILPIILLATVTTSAVAQEGRTTRDGFTWSERMSTGAWLRIHNYKGRVEVRETSGNQVEVRAEKQPSNGTVPEVRFEVVRDGQNVTICAMPVQNATCNETGLRARGNFPDWRRGSVVVTVLLPRGVRIHAGSGNGAVTVQNAGAEVVATSGNGEVRVSNAAASVRATSGNGDIAVSVAGGPVVARTGNGSIRVSTAEGPVNANTGNGSIDVRMRTLHGSDDMQLRSGNGRIVVRLPANFEGEVDARTGHGRFTSDFPLTVQGSLTGRQVRGTIGAGGRLIRMSSGNGALELRRLD